jgi:3-oxoacyl-[acyl-carrier-protein] synthase-3
MARYATILATGRYVPERVVTNAELEASLGQPVSDWLVRTVGIKERHIMADDQQTSDLAVAAAKQALDRAGLSPTDLDLIIVATDTPDYISPATASVVQAKLGAHNAGIYDINTACAAWVTGLDLASRYIATDPDYRHILLVGAYGMTRFMDWTDKYTCTLFADGAGAVVLGASPQPGFLAGKLLGSGEYHDALGVYTGGTFRPATPENVAIHGKPRVQFVRKLPATFNTEHWPALIAQVLAKAELTLDDVNLFVFTQLNLRTIEATMATLGQPMSKTHWIMDKWGYTGSACIPMALDDAVEQRRLRPGDHVVFCASGGGLAMAVVAMRWTIDS